MIFSTIHIGRQVIRKSDSVIFRMYGIQTSTGLLHLACGYVELLGTPGEFELAPTPRESVTIVRNATCKHIPGHGCEICDAVAVLNYLVK